MPVYNHTGLVVTDLDRTKRFYEQVLGFQTWYEAALPDEAVVQLLGLAPPLGIRLCYLTLDGCVLELMQFTATGAQAAWRRRTMNEPGLTHLSISVGDIGKVAQQAVECGGKIVEDSDIGIALFIRDPDGQLLELLSMDYPGSRPPKPQPVETAGGGL